MNGFVEQPLTGLDARGDEPLHRQREMPMTALPDIPLPAGIRSRFVDDINGLRMHVLEAGFETKAGPACCCCTAFPNSPIAGAR